jgi:hypothetical protein
LKKIFYKNKKNFSQKNFSEKKIKIFGENLKEKFRKKKKLEKK